MMHNRLFATLLLTFTLPVVVTACIWDYDTLKMERQRFPGTLEVITGKFLRHSPAFYEWRVKDRLAKIEKDPKNLSNYDDLAVAYHKLGQTDKAIEWMQKKDKLKPGLYETEANLSAFYMLSGQWEKGLEHVNKALAINPNAHFGREKYQKYLAEYVLERMKANGGKLVLPMSSTRGTFSAFLRQRMQPAGFDRRDALKAIRGMMIFAKHDSPVLLETLSDVLAEPNDSDEEDAKLLAARALTQASYVCEEPAKSAYRRLAIKALEMQLPEVKETRNMTMAELEAKFKMELSDGAAFYRGIEIDEMNWLREKKNPEKEFDRVYYKEPVVDG